MWWFWGPWWKRGRRWWRPRGWCWYFWSVYWFQQMQQNKQSWQNWYSASQNWNNWMFKGNPQQVVSPYFQPRPLSDTQRLEEEIKRKAKEILSKATVVPSWGWGPIPILHNGIIVGYLWENVPLKKVKVGSITQLGNIAQVMLLFENRIVGMLWVAR